MKDSDQPPLQARQRMVDQQVISRHFELELGNDGAARRHRDGLNAPQWLAQNAAEIVNPIEHFADDVERRGEIRTTDPEENTDGLADFSLTADEVSTGRRPHR